MLATYNKQDDLSKGVSLYIKRGQWCSHNNNVYVINKNYYMHTEIIHFAQKFWLATQQEPKF